MNTPCAYTGNVSEFPDICLEGLLELDSDSDWLTAAATPAFIDNEININGSDDQLGRAGWE